MRPGTMSATSGMVYEDCPARWKVEFFDDRAPSVASEATGLGRVVHQVLETWVKGGCHTTPPPQARTVMADLYDAAYWGTFSDKSRYAEGLHLVHKWLQRTDFYGREVLTVEKRDHFMLPTSAGPMKWVYVMDRLDRLDTAKFEVEVIDYKTVSVPVTPDQLHDRLQARAYAVAAQILFPEAERVWVTFDLMRFEGPVGTVFTKEENRDNWRYLAKLCQRIVDDHDAHEQLNANCRYCIRKGSCETLARHIRAKGPLGITDPTEAAEKRVQLDHARRAIDAQVDELDDVLLKYLEHEELLSYDTDTLRVEVTASRRRVIDSERAAPILGPDIMMRCGNLQMGTIDELLKSHELTDEQKTELRGLIRQSIGEPRIKITEKK